MFHSISRKNNMNLVRYYLALCILVNHFASLTGIDIFQLPRIFGGAGSFFALSGFLMFPSYEKRPDPKRFLSRRARRIFPPYFLIVIVAAIGLSLISTIPLSVYFLDPGFWKYVGANLCFLNFLHPDLPGVFDNAPNITASVNGALWTMKGEVLCYLSVPIVYKAIRRSRRFCRNTLAVTVAVCAALYIIFTRINGGSMEVLGKQFNVFMLFFLGALINLELPLFLKYRRHILVFNILLLGADYFSLLEYIPVLGTAYEVALSPFVTGSMVIICCLTGRWGWFLSGHNAVSYDIYLFHWPVIQLLVYFGFVAYAGAYTALMTAIAITVGFAFLSWHCIGSRILDRKKPRPDTIPRPAPETACGLIRD